jgi:hypothetical protein
MSTSHSDDTYKLLNLKTKKVIYRRQVFFNERSFPARKQQIALEPVKVLEDTAEDIIGLHFEDEGERYLITGTSRTKEGELVVDYRNVISQRNEKPKGYVSTVKEVRQWIGQTKLTQAAASITTKRNGYINDLAEEMFQQITNYEINKTTTRNKGQTNKLPQGRQYHANPMVPS